VQCMNTRAAVIPLPQVIARKALLAGEGTCGGGEGGEGGDGGATPGSVTTSTANGGNVMS